jgi:LAO/AO transport system kinase
MGDDIQAIKAGILEIADVFVINKADRPGADRVATDLESMMSLAPEVAGRPRPAIFRTVAVSDDGVEDLKNGIAHWVASAGSERRLLRRRERAEMRLTAILAERWLHAVRARILGEPGFAQTVAEIAERRLDPYTAADRVLGRVEIR